MAALQGDLVFQAPRRFLLEHVSKTQTAFAFRTFSTILVLTSKKSHLLLVYKRGKATPYLGAFHSSDIPEFYGDGSAPDFIGTDALSMFLKSCLSFAVLNTHVYSVNFANTGNPTIPYNSNSLLSSVDWKPWNSSPDHPLLTFLDPAPDVAIAYDTYRADAMKLLNNITLKISYQ